MSDQEYPQCLSLLQQGPSGLATAYPIIKKAAEEDNSDAQVQLGMIFEGLTISHLPGPFQLMHNHELSAHWYKLAAESENRDGLYHYGRIAYLGRLGEKKKSLAPIYWNKAVELGSKKASFCLAKLYLRGEFVVQDLKCAYILASLSKDLPESAKLLSQIRSSLYPNFHELDALSLSATSFALKFEALKNDSDYEKSSQHDSIAEKSSWDLIVDKLASTATKHPDEA
jgi:TPR repeat protein